MRAEADRCRYLLRRALNSQIPLGGLTALVELRGLLNSIEMALVTSAREKGATWGEVAEVLNITRQALHARLRGQAP